MQGIFLTVTQVKMNSDLQSIRTSCDLLLPYATANKLKHFIYDEDNLHKTADYVTEVITSNYPDLNVPYHSRLRHFPPEYSKLDLESQIELVIISVLLDGGNRLDWCYKDAQTNTVYSKSEGLGMASYRMYTKYRFPTKEQFIECFQISDTNKLIGMEERFAMLQRLKASDEGKSPLEEITNFFLPGQTESVVSIEAIFYKLKISLSGVLPNDAAIYKGYDMFFYKLLQWLCYSLWEVLENFGYKVTDTDMLTGLPEYRNGGLVVDLGVLTPRDPNMYEQRHEINSEFIVEWRAMTVVLLDQIAMLIRHRLNKTHAELPLSKILQGGTWYAGRKIAAELRADGAPPFKVISDGTVF
jgi:hypothetical protein